MPSNRRARELARAKAERQRARRQDRARRRRIIQVVSVIAILAVVVGGITWFALGRGGDPAADGASPAPTETPTEAPTAAPTEAPTPGPTEPTVPPTDPPTPPPDLDCAPAPEPRPDDQSFPAADDVIAPDTDYRIRLATNCGRIVIDTLPEAAPVTVNSMVFLAEQGYFDLTSCHRVTTEGIFVLQCGDPAGDGTGGPGYTIPEENLPVDAEVTYPAGTVAMARTAAPGSGGSQFFIVYRDTVLPPDYTIWGTIAQGLDIVQGVAAAGVEQGGGDATPVQPIVIETATVVATPRGS